MPKFRKATLLLALLFMLIPLVAAQEESDDTQSHDSIREELRANRDAITQIRNGQLNYRVEKDLLKEAYSSNLKTIEVTITIVLGLFAIFGFFGLRTISEIKDKFSDELSRVQGLRSEFENKLADLKAAQEQAESKISAIDTTNEQQDIRLQVLEIQEKVGSLISQHEHTRALEYIEAGLHLSPNDLVLLRQKAHCFSSLGRLPEAISTYKKVIEEFPEDEASPMNLAELYLLSRDLQKYENCLSQYPGVAAAFEGKVGWYLDSLRCYVESDSVALREGILKGLQHLDDSAKENFVKWSFDELRHAFGGDPQTPSKSLLWKFADLIEGRISVGELREHLHASQ